MQHPVVNTEAGSNPGAPLAWGSPENPDDVVAGYGYVAADTSDVEETFYYHSDHLGSTSYITDQKANVTQYDAYLPYGELLVDEHSSSKEMPYKFNGKELDEETGLYYYGARYMNPITSMWYGVDPLTEQYVNIGAYIYCHGNPIKLIDPDGQGDYYMKNGTYLGTDNNTDDFVYLSTGRNSDGTFADVERLDISKHHFDRIANIIKKEGASNNPKEYLYIAHTIRNRAKTRKTTMWNLLRTKYSSVDDKDKDTPISKVNSGNALSARAALIDVLSGNPDPTDGSEYWDGTDFLAWGLKSPYKYDNGEIKPHAKFREYNTITISDNIFSQYCNSQMIAYKGRVNYKGKPYNLPQDVFLDPENWNSNGFQYSWPGSASIRFNLVATHAVGKTIFWRPEKRQR